jgi:hypothetical protein
MGTPLPGSRPDRARANDARFGGTGQNPVADQGGFGKEDMIRPANYLSMESAHAADAWPPPDLASMGDGGEPFGGC